MEIEIEGSFDVADWFTESFYTCKVKSSSITKPGTRVTSFRGVHQAGKSNADIEAITFSGVVVKYFPLGLYEIFPNLKHIEIRNCGLLEVSRRDLCGSDSLASLYLDKNHLKSLPDNLFREMTKLTRISARMNEIEFVSSELLKPLKNNNVVCVDFTGNPANMGFYGRGFSGSLKSLRELGVVIDKNCQKPKQSSGNFMERTIDSFKRMWTTGCFSDFIIVCESKEFKVHKSTLMTHSSVLETSLQHDMQESKTGRMEIKDFSKEAVEDFLKYMYTGETPDGTNAMELFALASKYDVHDLQNLMEDIVVDNIDESNALEVLTMANQHNCKFMAQEAFNKIQAMFPESKLDPKLLNHPEGLKELIDTKRKYQRLLQSCSDIVMLD